MNSRFLEFLGQYFIQTAKWQQRMEQASGGKAPEGMDGAEIMRLFQQFFGWSGSADPALAESFRMWQQYMDNFQAAFNASAKIWGWVPKSEYQTLQDKCEALEKTVRKQEQVISQLRSLLEEKGMGQIELMQRFQSLIQDQSNEFQTFMQNFGDAVLKTADPKANG